MKIFLENKFCSLSIRAHFHSDRTSFPVAHVENLFCFEGYVHVNVGDTDDELALSADEASYLLPPRVKELELFLAGNEVGVSTVEVPERMLKILAYANKYKITVEVLRHPLFSFFIDERQKPINTKAMESAKMHVDIVRQTTGTQLTVDFLVRTQSTWRPAASLLTAHQTVDRTSSALHPSSSATNNAVTG